MARCVCGGQSAQVILQEVARTPHYWRSASHTTLYLFYQNVKINFQVKLVSSIEFEWYFDFMIIRE